MQGISNHTYQDLIQDLSFIIRKTEDSAIFTSSELEHLLYIIRTVFNLKKVLPHYLVRQLHYTKNRTVFSLFKPVRST